MTTPIRSPSSSDLIGGLTREASEEGKREGQAGRSAAGFSLDRPEISQTGEYGGTWIVRLIPSLRSDRKEGSHGAGCYSAAVCPDVWFTCGLETAAGTTGISLSAMGGMACLRASAASM